MEGMGSVSSDFSRGIGLQTAENDLKKVKSDRQIFKEQVVKFLENAKLQPSDDKKSGRKVQSYNKSIDKLEARINQKDIDSSKEMKAIWGQAQKAAKKNKGYFAEAGSAKTEINQTIRAFKDDLKVANKDLKALEKTVKVKQSLFGSIKAAFSSLKVSTLSDHLEKVKSVIVNVGGFGLNEEEGKIIDDHRKMANFK